MTTDLLHHARTVAAAQVRHALIAGDEIVLLDVRSEHDFAQGHPLFAAQIPLTRIEAEARWRIPRPDTPVIVYDDGEGLSGEAVVRLAALGFTHAAVLENGLTGWREAGYELFEDVNSYSKAFGELVEHIRGTPSLPAQDVQALIRDGADIAILDARRFDEYHVMSIPTASSVPGAELVLRAPIAAPDPGTTIIVNCAGRTRSIIGTQSLVNAGLPNPVFALRNGTIGWTLTGQDLDTGQSRSIPQGEDAPARAAARATARDVAYRAGVKWIDRSELTHLRADERRTLYLYDVRQPDAFLAGHLPGFRNAQGGQLVQETDHYAPVRGARIVLADDIDVRANMTASWLAQLGWETYVLDVAWPEALETGPDGAPPPRGPEGRYKRPYEGTDNKVAAMQAYLDWEYGLVDQLERDGTHGFRVI